jgi:hypothetical protein
MMEKEKYIKLKIEAVVCANGLVSSLCGNKDL